MGITYKSEITDIATISQNEQILFEAARRMDEDVRLAWLTFDLFEKVKDNNELSFEEYRNSFDDYEIKPKEEELREMFDFIEYSRDRVTKFKQIVEKAAESEGQKVEDYLYRNYASDSILELRGVKREDLALSKSATVSSNNFALVFELDYWDGENIINGGIGEFNPAVPIEFEGTTYEVPVIALRRGAYKPKSVFEHETYHAFTVALRKYRSEKYNDKESINLNPDEILEQAAKYLDPVLDILSGKSIESSGAIVRDNPGVQNSLENGLDLILLLAQDELIADLRSDNSMTEMENALKTQVQYDYILESYKRYVAQTGSFYHQDTYEFLKQAYSTKLSETIKVAKTISEYYDSHAPSRSDLFPYVLSRVPIYDWGAYLEHNMFTTEVEVSMELRKYIDEVEGIGISTYDVLGDSYIENEKEREIISRMHPISQQMDFFDETEIGPKLFKVAELIPEAKAIYEEFIRTDSYKIGVSCRFISNLRYSILDPSEISQYKSMCSKLEQDMTHAVDKVALAKQYEDTFRTRFSEKKEETVTQII